MSSFSASLTLAFGLTLLVLVSTKTTRASAHGSGVSFDRTAGDVCWI